MFKGHLGIPSEGRTTGVGGADVDVDGVGEGVGGSIGGEEDATKCRTASRKTSTIFSIGSERKDSMAGSFRG